MSKFGFSKIIAELEGSKQELLQELADSAKSHFIDNFNSASFNKQAWEPAKDGHTPLLVKSGQLKSDLENADISINNDGYSIQIDNEYGSYHNEGTSTLPKREFVGPDEELDKKQEKIIENHINKLFK